MVRVAAILRIAGALVSALAVAASASAVLIADPDGSGNVAPFPDPALDYAATRGGLSAVYLGDGAVLTANHVGAGDVVIDGVAYPWVPGSQVRLRNEDGSGADLLLFAIEPHPDLPPLPIASVRPPYGTLLIAIGNGRNRGGAESWDPNGPHPPGVTDGFAWAPGASLRWGTNVVELFPGQIYNTHAFGSVFQSGGSYYEAQAVNGDSGGAVFAWDFTNGMQLAGVVIAISQYTSQPAETSYYGQNTYYADLAYYRDDILDAIAMPEPGAALWPGVALLLALAEHRERTRSRSRSSRPLAQACETS